MGPYDYYQNSLYQSLLTAPVRRCCFISYYSGDERWAQSFVDRFATTERIFIPKAIGLNYQDDEIQSSNPKYVMGEIRERLIDRSSVQIVLIGPCTHSRRYVDCEIKRSLPQGNGLLGILLPPDIRAYLPPRFADNHNSGYARFYLYPSSGEC